MAHSRRNWWRTLAVLAALGLLAAGCGDDDGGGEVSTETSQPRGVIGEDGSGEVTVETGQYGGSITVALEAETPGWTPGQFNFVSGITVALSIYDPLISVTGDGEFVPNLAESLESNDDLTEWTLTLREGIVFHDGSPLDAETLKWNFDTLHMADGSNTKGSLTGGGVTGMEVVDELTVTYVLSGPNAAFPDLLRLAAGMPVSRQAYESMGPDAFAASPVGTGPFEFVEWTRDDRLVVRRNEDYWRTDEEGNQLPYLDEIVFRPIPDEESRIQSLASDAVQVMATSRGSSAKQVIALTEERDFLANVHVGNISSGTIFNVLQPPVDDLRVRKALAMAHRPLDVAAVLGDDGLVDISTGFFTEQSPWFSEEVRDAYVGYPTDDPDAARALIDEYRNDPNRSDGKAPGDPVEVVYSCLPDPSLVEIAQLMQGLWNNIGVEVSMRVADQATHVTAVMGAADTSPPFRGDFMAACWRAGAGDGDPLTAMTSFFGPPETQPLNFTNFYSEEITEQLAIMRTNADFEVRYAAAERIGVIANENVIQTWSPAAASLVGWRSDIKGIVDWTLPGGEPGTGTPSTYMNFRQVWIEQG